MSKILITGVTGFVGQAVCKRLRLDGIHVLAGTTRQPDSDAGPELVPLYHVPEIGPETDWTQAVSGAEIVIHLAARVHIMKEQSSNPFTVFSRVNSEGTKALAEQAAEAGVKRFVFISTVKVAGETSPNTGFTEMDLARPEDDYSTSKWHAEQALADIAKTTEMEIVILRPPLVYGPGVKGNFNSLFKVVRAGIILPLGSIQNKRSLLFVGNLADAIASVVVHPDAGNQTFFVSDAENISTPELIQRISGSLGKKTCVRNFPLSLLKIGGFLIGKSNTINRLIRTLTIDINHIRTHLGWQPPFTMEEGLKETAKWFNRDVSK
jgi:nucleoside-diphosphate-sugar epimerase